jgi:hypothetical protein
VTLADAGALDDPLVRGVDHPLQVLVREHPRRCVAARAEDTGSWCSAMLRPGRHVGRSEH